VIDETTHGSKHLRLSVIPLFRQLSPDDLEKVSRLMVEVSHKGGDTIFLQNEPGDALYVVHSGKVRVWVRDGDGNDQTSTTNKSKDS
jgi:CRP/FNR family transcriptional regulator, cyclic AMP receptor protein